MLRGVAALVTGFAMMASFGILGVGTASAASPVHHIRPGSIWSGVTKGERSYCEQLTFSPNGTFTSDKYNDSGTWTGGGTTITVNWTMGTSSSGTFTGTLRKGPVAEYRGTAQFKHFTFSFKLVEGALAGC